MFHRWNGGTNQQLEIRPTWSDENITAGFSFLRGGVSPLPWESLNLGFHVNDDSQRVLENRRLWSQTRYGTVEEWVVGEQVHGTRVTTVVAADAGKGATLWNAPMPACDALITQARGTTLVVLTADCVPVLFYDPVQQAIGAAHSGWRGTVDHIAVRVLERMAVEFSTRPEDVRVSIGPSIRSCCYEVDELVANPVRVAFGSRVLWKRPARVDKYLLSLQSCIRADLLDCGVAFANVDDVGVCTSCHHDVLFSHRADKGKTGRQCGAIRLPGN